MWAFRRRQSNDLVEVAGCPCAGRAPLCPSPPLLRRYLNRLKSQREAGHAELIQAEQGIMMLLRHTGRPNEADRALLVAFAEAQGIDLYLQAADERIEPLRQQFQPSYTLDGLSLAFAPATSFRSTAPSTRAWLTQALTWLQGDQGRQGAGSLLRHRQLHLPLARQAREVVGGRRASPWQPVPGERPSQRHQTTPVLQGGFERRHRRHVPGRGKGSIWYLLDPASRGAGSHEPRGGNFMKAGGLCFL